MTDQTFKLKTYSFDPETNRMIEDPNGRFCMADQAKEIISTSVSQSLKLANAINFMALSMNLTSDQTLDVMRLTQICHVVTETMAESMVKSGVTLKKIAH